MFKRLLKGASAQAFSQPVGVLIQLSSVPLLLSYWGTNLYGEWLVLFAATAYLAMSDIGFTTATFNKMTMQVARNDRVGALKTFQSSWVLVSILSITMIGLCILFISFNPPSAWFGFTALDGEASSLIIMLLFLYIALSLQTELLFAAYYCEGAYGFGAFLLILIRLFEFGLVVVAVIGGGDPVSAATAFVAGRFIGLIFLRGVLYRICPWLHYGIDQASFSEVRTLLSPALGFTGFTIGNALNVQGMLIITGTMLGSAPVVVLNTLRIVTRGLRQLLSGLLTTVMPEISIASGKDNAQLVRKLHAYTFQLILWLTVFVAIALWLWGDLFIQTWTNGKVLVQWDLFGMLIMIMIINALWFASLMVFYGTNTHQSIAKVYVGVNLLSLFLAGQLVEPLGLMGIAVALLAAEFVMMAYVVSKALTFFNQPFVEFVLFVLRPPLRRLFTIFMQRVTNAKN